MRFFLHVSSLVLEISTLSDNKDIFHFLVLMTLLEPFSVNKYICLSVVNGSARVYCTNIFSFHCFLCFILFPY